MNKACLKRIVQNFQITKIPQSADYITGIINLRGRIVTTISLGKKLVLDPVNRHKDNRNIIVNSEEEHKDPYVGWVEYWWPKPGETEPSRKITFIIQVPGQPYQVSAGIYDDTVSLEELEKMNK